MVVECGDETLNTNETLVRDKKVSCTKMCMYLISFSYAYYFLGNYTLVIISCQLC